MFQKIKDLRRKIAESMSIEACRKKYNEKIASEAYECGNPELMSKLKTSSDGFIQGFAEAAENLGKILQIEMKKRNEMKVTKRLLKKGLKEFIDNDRGGDFAYFQSKGVLHTLCATWRYGRETGELLGLKAEKYDAFVRKFEMNNTGKNEEKKQGINAGKRGIELG